MKLSCPHTARQLSRGRGAIGPSCRRRAALALLLGAALLGCRSTPAPAPADTAAAATSELPEWNARYAQLAAAGGTVLHADAQRSSVRILVFRGGRAARLGHNHVLTAPEFGGLVYLPPSGIAGAQADLEFRLDALQMDDPALRASLGPAFAATLSPGDIANTRAHMLGGDNFEADRFPFVRIHLLQITGEDAALAADVEVRMHGRKQTLAVPLTVDGLPGHAAVKGALVLRQSDFGVKPYSALGGLIAVQDAVLVEFTLLAD